jgi:hypothetical protein
MKIIITESQYELLNEQLYKQIGNLFKSSPKIVKPISKTISKSISSELNSLIKTYIQKVGEDEFIKLRKSLLNKEISKEEFFNTLRTNSKFNLSKMNLVTNVGIRFSEKESNMINKVSNDILGKSYDRLSSMNLTLPLTRGNVVINSKIVFVDKDWVIKNLPDKIKTEMWVDGNDIYVFVDNIKGYDKNRLVTIITHEAAHIKDPSLYKSPKLQKSYPESEFFTKTEAWSDDWIKRYYTHPFETNAITAQVLEHMTSVVKSKSKKLKPDEIIKSLDTITSYASSPGVNPNWSDLSLEILGYSGKNGKSEISNHFNILNEKNPGEFKKLLSKISKHSLNLKSELSRFIKSV